MAIVRRLEPLALEKDTPHTEVDLISRKRRPRARETRAVEAL